LAKRQVEAKAKLKSLATYERSERTTGGREKAEPENAGEGIMIGEAQGKRSQKLLNRWESDMPGTNFEESTEPLTGHQRSPSLAKVFG
jgi:hypothetical protein